MCSYKTCIYHAYYLSTCMTAQSSNIILEIKLVYVNAAGFLSVLQVFVIEAHTMFTQSIIEHTVLSHASGDGEHMCVYRVCAFVLYVSDCMYVTS